MAGSLSGFKEVADMELKIEQTDVSTHQQLTIGVFLK